MTEGGNILTRVYYGGETSLITINLGITGR